MHWCSRLRPNQRIASRIETVNLNDDALQRMMQISQANIDFFLKHIASQATSGYAQLPAVPTDEF